MVSRSIRLKWLLEKLSKRLVIKKSNLDDIQKEISKERENFMFKKVVLLKAGRQNIIDRIMRVAKKINLVEINVEVSRKELNKYFGSDESSSTTETTHVESYAYEDITKFNDATKVESISPYSHCKSYESNICQCFAGWNPPTSSTEKCTKKSEVKSYENCI